MTLPLSPFAGALRGTITRAQLCLDNGVLVAAVEVTTAQGTYPAQLVALDNYNPDALPPARQGTAFGCEVIRQLMVAADVTRWDWLIGRKVRAHLDRTRTRILAIHHDTDDTRSWDPVAIAGRC